MIKGIRYFENLHVFFWLIKDSCWMMNWQTGGTIMFFPTIGMSVFLCLTTRKEPLHLLPNAAVLCWICANSVWMFGDFYHIKFLTAALIFFASGILLIGLYLYKIFLKNRI